MEKITRFGVSIESNLLKKFDKLINKIGYSNRSEAIRDLIRDRLVAEEWKEADKETVGILGLVYNHEKRELTENLTKSSISISIWLFLQPIFILTTIIVWKL